MQLEHARPQHDTDSTEGDTCHVHQVLKTLLEDSKAEISELRRCLTEQTVRARVAEAEAARLSELARVLEGRLQATEDQCREILVSCVGRLAATGFGCGGTCEGMVRH